MSDRHPLLVALEPVARRLGAELVGSVDDLRPDDVPLEWDGVVVGGLRLPVASSDGLGELLAKVEAEVGAPLAQLTREEKQDVVQRLDARGAFRYRKAVEDIADALGVSRFTVYNYLNARS